MTPRRRRAARALGALVAAGLLAAGTAAAQDPYTFTASADSTAAPVPVSGLKSGSTALALSLLGTAVPALLSAPTAFGESEGPGDGTGAALMFLGAVVVGPSLGHFYAERPGRAFLGIGLRIVALAAAAGAVATDYGSSGDQGEGLGAFSLLLGGSMVLLDVVLAPQSAEIHNAEVRRRQVTVGVAPPARGPGLGLWVALAF